MPRIFTVHYERDEDGWWVATINSEGVVTQGRTLEQARERVRDALATALGSEVAANANLKETTGQASELRDSVAGQEK